MPVFVVKIETELITVKVLVAIVTIVQLVKKRRVTKVRRSILLRSMKLSVDSLQELRNINIS